VSLASDVTEEILDQAAAEATLGLDDTEPARLEASVAVVNAVYGARSESPYSPRIWWRTGRTGVSGWASSSRPR
jgi:hypothetical protein